MSVTCVSAIARSTQNGFSPVRVRNAFLICAKHSSQGFNSGEYVGRNMRRMWHISNNVDNMLDILDAEWRDELSTMK